MSTIERALRQIDFQHEREIAAASRLPSQSNRAPVKNTPAPRTFRRRWLFLLLLLGLTASLIAVAIFYSFGSRQLDRGINVDIVKTNKQSPASLVTPAPLGPEALPNSSPVPSAESINAPFVAPTVVALLPRAAWQLQGAQAWESGAWDNAARLWLDGLRSTAATRLALQIADFQTLEQAQLLHQTWSRDWPVVILARVTPAGQRWTVLVLPAATEVGAALQHLSQMLGYAVASASVAQWVAKADIPQSVPASVALNVHAATATLTLPIPQQAKQTKQNKPDKVDALGSAASRALPVTTEAAPAPAQPPTEPAQISRSNGQAPTDKARAATATKAIDVDFASVELLLTKGEFDKALSASEQLENYVGANWRTRYLTGAALSGLRRWEEAITALTNARQKNPGHLRVALYLAVALQEIGDHGGAFDTLVLVGQTHPDAPDIWLNKGHSLQALGRAEEASLAYRRFMDLSASRSDLNQQRSWVSKRLEKNR